MVLLVLPDTVLAADTTPPTAPTNVVASSVTQTSATLNWTASTDNVGVTGYHVYRDGTHVGTVYNGGNPPASTYAITGLTCGTSYSIQIVAADASNNWTVSSPLTLATASCASPPTVTITSPQLDAVIDSTSASVEFATTNSPTSTTCALDAGAPAACESPLAYNNLSEGEHAVTVTVENAAGSSSAVASFTVDSIDPAVTITAPTEGQVTGPDLDINFTADGTGTAVTGTTCQLDGAAAAPCTSPQSYAALTPGAHSVAVEATDEAGNTRSETVGFTVGSSSPQIVIDSPVDGETYDSFVEFSFSVVPAAAIECELSGSGWAPCPPSPMQVNFAPAPAGQYTFSVRLANDPDEANWTTSTFTVDHAPGPSISWESTPEPFDPSASKHFEFSVDDPTGDAVVECSVDGAEFSACESPYEVTGLASGVHYLTVKATNSAGNSSSIVSPAFYSFDPSVVIEYSPEPTGPVGLNGPPIAIGSSIPVDRISCQFDKTLGDGSHSVQSFNVCPAQYNVQWGDPSGHVTIVATAWVDGVGQIGDPGTLDFEVDATEPSVVIADKPEDGTSFSEASPVVNFSSSDADLDHFECSVNETPSTVCSSPWTASNLPECVSALTVYAVDTAGNRGSDSETYWRNTEPSKVDTRVSCPTWTTNNAAPYFEIDPQDFKTDALVDSLFNPAGAMFECSIDGGAWTRCADDCSLANRQWIPCTGLNEIANIAAGPGPRSISVATVFDGERDPHPALITWESGVPAVEPTATFKTAPPREGSSSRPVVLLATDTRGSTFECRLDGADWHACPSEFRVQTEDGGPLALGSHTLEVRASTLFATQSEPTSATFVVTATLDAPSVTAGPSSGDTVTGPIRFEFTANSIVSRFECSTDGGPYEECSSPFTLPTSMASKRTFSVRAVALDGTAGHNAIRTVYTGDPDALADAGQVFIVDGPRDGDVVSSSTVSFGLSSNTEIVEFRCQIDGGAVEPCESRSGFQFADGEHSLTVLGVLPSGSYTLPAAVSFTVTAGASAMPLVEIDHGPWSDANPRSMAETRSPLVTFHATQDGLNFECRLDAEDWVGCESPHRLSQLTPSLYSHRFEVRAKFSDGTEAASAAIDFALPDYTNDAVSLRIYPTGEPVGWADFSDGTVVSSGDVSFSATATGSPFPGWSEAESDYALKCSVDGGDWRFCGTVFTASGLANGTHTLTVRSPDAPGHRGITERREFMVSSQSAADQSVPLPNVTGGPDDETVPSDSASFSFEIPAQMRAECRVDNARYGPCISPYSTPSLDNGDHTFSVRLVQPDGTFGVAIDKSFETSDESYDRFHYGTIVSVTPDGDVITWAAFNQMKRKIIEGFAPTTSGATNGSGGSGASTFSTASNFASTPTSDDPLMLVNFLKAAGAYPDEDRFMQAMGAAPKNLDTQVRVDITGTYKDSEDAEAPTQHQAMATQRFYGGTYEDKTETKNGLDFYKSMELWGYSDQDRATGEPLAQPRMYARGTDLGVLFGVTCNLAYSSCQATYGDYWRRWANHSDGGFVCNGVGGGSTWLSGFPETFGALGSYQGSIDVVVEGEATCAEGPGGSVPTSEPIEKVYEWLDTTTAYNTFATSLDIGADCDAPQPNAVYNLCHSIPVNLDDIDPTKVAAACKMPQFQEFCKQTGVDDPRRTFGDPGEAGRGDPVNAISGNFTSETVDVSAVGLGDGVEMLRAYNSRDDRTSAVGQGWSWVGSEGLAVLSTGDVRVAMRDGKTLDFEVQQDGSYSSPYGEELKLTKIGELFVMTDPYGTEQTVYSGEGKVLWKIDANGRQINYTYEDGRLTRIASDTEQYVDFTYGSDGMLATALDSSGRASTYSHDGVRLSAVTNPEDGEVQFEYDQNGYLSEARNPDGKLAVANNYDSRGRVTSQRVGDSDPASFTYETRQTIFTDSEGGKHSLRYNAHAKTTSTEGPNGSRDVLHRNSAGHVTSITRADGRSTSYEYDGAGRVTREVDPAGNETLREYNSAGDVTLETDPLGHTSTFTYNPDRTLATSTDPLGQTTQYTWFSPGLLASSTDPLGRTTSYTHDTRGRPASVTDALGHSSSMTYGAHDALASSTDPLGRTTSYSYSPMGRPTATTTPSGSTMAYQYDDAGNLTQSTDGRGHVTSTTYDAFERPVATAVEGTAVSESGYDDNGQQIWTRDGNGATSKFAYDKEGRLLRSVSAERATSTYKYDELGRKIRETDARGNSTSYEYDLVGNLIAVVDASGARTAYTYDAVGNLTSETDALGRVTSYTYDAANRLVSEQKPLGLQTTYTYDAAGQMTSKSVAGETTTYQHDALGRVTHVTPAVGNELTFAFDAAGQMTSASVASGQSVGFSYDVDGRVQSTTDALGQATQYAYDAASNVTSFTDTSGETTIEYDAQNRPTKITTPSGREHEFKYDGSGNLTRQEVFRTSAGDRRLVTSTDRFFDRDGRLYAAYARNNRGKLLSSLEYTYDENGNPTRKQTESSDQQYAYDVLNRITGVSYANQTDTYTYNAAGERTSKNGEAYTYNALGEMLSAPGNVTYSYDPQGRRTAKTTPGGTETYAFNSLDQLTARTAEDSSTSTYEYDALGRLTSTASGLFTRSYNYATGDSPARITSHLTGAEGVATRTERVSYGPAGMLEAQAGEAAPTYPVFDTSGTLTAAISDNGEAKAEPARDPFGELLPGEVIQKPSGQLDDPTLAFAGAFGRETLPGSDLVKMGARVYDPGTGAFISRDPVTGDAAEPARRAAYAYAFNGPARYLDLDGRSVKDSLCEITAVCRWAPGALEWQERTINDPHASGLKKLYAKVGKVISSQFKCENLPGTLMFAIPGPFGKGRALKMLDEALPGAKYIVGASGEVRIFVTVRGATVEVSEHAARRITQRGLTVDSVAKVMNSASPFRYFHAGVWKTGYYDPTSRVFVGRVGNTITTVIDNASPKYIKNLKAAAP